MKREVRQNSIFSRYKKEIIMTASLLLIAIISLLIITATRDKGSIVEVYVSDELIGEYPLSSDGEYKLLSGDVTLVIKDGRAYVSHSDCPDKVCVKTGEIYRTGERIVCLPNKLTVIIRGERTDSSPDIVS